MPRPVDARGGPTGDNEFIKLVVSDTGCGIPLEVQPRIFEPFFTTKEQGKGTGMGLSMVYGIVKNHGGSICVTSDADRGTRFEIFLPAVARPELVVEDNEESRAGTGGATILLVDDEELVRDVASTMLETLGYRVMTAHDGADAVELYRRQEHQIDLVILDMAMPRLGGRDCFRAMCEINPAVRAILSTGYTLDDTTQSILDEGMVGFAQKPYVMDELADTVSRALEGPSSRGLRPPVTPRRIVSRKP
jgi:CheY-like chemotaxis protein